jgi:hypothetical protein
MFLRRPLIEFFKSRYTDRTLTILLLLGAVLVVAIALYSKNPALKALTLAYILLP